MTKTELVQAIQDFCDEAGEELSKNQIKAMLDGLGRAIQESVEDVDRTTIPGIGRVSCTLRNPRKGHNPATGEAVDIPAKVAVRITPAKILKESVPSVAEAKRKLAK